MGDSSSIDGYVESLTAEGEIDSLSSDFSISEEAALAKLSGLLENPQHWVLKAIQAGVVGECESISIRIGRKSTEVIWTGLSPIPATDVREALARSTPMQNSFVDELVVGLRAIFGVCFFRFCGEGELVAEADRALTSGQTSTGRTMLLVEHPGRSTLGFAAKSQRDAIAEQTRVLSQKCLFCSVPITVDGRVITQDQHRVIRKFGGPHYSDSPVSLVDVHLVRRDSGWVLSSAPYLHKTFSRRTWNRTPVINSDPSTASSNRLLIWSSLELSKRGGTCWAAKEDGSVYWVRHGVVCGESRIYQNLSLGLALSLDASHVRSDLSGLSLGQKPLTQQEVETLVGVAWEQSKPLLKAKLDQKLPRFGFPRFSEISGRILTSLVGFIVAGTILVPVSYLLVSFPQHQAIRIAMYILGTGALVGFSVIPQDIRSKRISYALTSFDHNLKKD